MTESADGSARSRAVFSLLVQILSSANNGLIVLAVARVASVETFGAATLLFAFAAAAMSVTRGTFGTPIMLASGTGGKQLRDEAGFALAAGLFFGLCVAGTVWITAAMFDVLLLGAAFATAIPLVVLSVVLRDTLISAGSPRTAAIWDLLGATGSAALYAATFVRPGTISEVSMVLLWSVLILLSVAGMAFSGRLRPRICGIGAWWSVSAWSRVRYGIEAGLGQIKIIVITSIATVVIGASAAASLRGAATLLSPLAVMLGALPLIVIPEAVRNATTLEALWRRLNRMALGGVLLVIIAGSSLLLLPDDAGKLLLGESWSYARSVLLVTSLEYAALVWNAVGMVFLRYQAKSAQLLTATLIYTSAAVALSTVMAFMTKTALGVAWGGAISAMAIAVGVFTYARPTRVRGGV